MLIPKIYLLSVKNGNNTLCPDHRSLVPGSCTYCIICLILIKIIPPIPGSNIRMFVVVLRHIRWGSIKIECEPF